MSEADGSGLCMPIIKYLLILGHVMRVSFLNVNHFAHLNREMVKEEFDVALKRDVIAIKSQRVPLHLVHVFSNVAPGNPPFNLHPEKKYKGCPVKFTLFFSGWQKHLRFSRVPT